MHENEEWRDIAGYEGLYKVSNLGRVMRIKGGPGARPGGILKPQRHPGGYPHVTLYRSGEAARRYVHRLVAFAFLTGEVKREVDHIDGNKANNGVENLRWVTPAENMSNPVTIKRLKERRRAAKPVVCVETGRVFDRISSAARYLRASAGNICSAARGTIKTAYGFHWRYATPDEINKLKDPRGG